MCLWLMVLVLVLGIGGWGVQGLCLRFRVWVGGLGGTVLFGKLWAQKDWEHCLRCVGAKSEVLPCMVYVIKKRPRSIVWPTRTHQPVPSLPVFS